MATLYALNFIVWATVSGGLMWATHSKHVCDGLLIKIALASVAVGAAANAIKPTFNSQLWIGTSIALVIAFSIIRLMEARLKGQKPVFLVF